MTEKAEEQVLCFPRTAISYVKVQGIVKYRKGAFDSDHKDLLGNKSTFSQLVVKVQTHMQHIQGGRLC